MRPLHIFAQRLPLWAPISLISKRNVEIPLSTLKCPTKAVIHSWAARSFCERVLNSCICQDCDVKTSKVTLTFHYLFFILICYISVLSFIYNLCWVLLLMNHLKPPSGDGKIYLFKLKPLTGFRTLFYLSKTFDPFTKAIPRVLCELCGK